MKYLPLLWRTLFRRKVRTIFTLLAVLVAFTLFGFLAAIGAAFSMGVELAGNERLVMIHKVSLIQLLPESYLERIRATPGVVDACSQTYFGGIYQDPKNFFMQIPVDPECMLRMYPEFTLPEEQKKAWIADRQGAIVGRQTAAKFGWKVGDRIPLQATIWRKKDNSSNWEFNLDGIYSGTEQGTDKTQFFFHYKYFDESRLFGAGQRRLVRRTHRQRVAGPADRREARRAVRQLAGRDEDHHREGLRAGVREPGRQHRADRAQHHRDGVLHHPAGDGQHDGRVGARAHERTRGPQDAGLLRRPGAGAGAGRVVHHRRRGRPARARPGGDASCRGSPPGTSCRTSTCRRRRLASASRSSSGWASSPASSRPCARCACASWTRYGGCDRHVDLLRSVPGGGRHRAQPADAPRPAGLVRGGRGRDGGRRRRPRVRPVDRRGHQGHDGEHRVAGYRDRHAHRLRLRDDEHPAERGHRRREGCAGDRPGARRRAARVGRAVRRRRSREGEHRNDGERVAARRRAGRLPRFATSR